MNDVTSQLLYFYNRHPISRDIILAKLQASRGHLDNLRPEELSQHDQDHYGGLKATDELARQAKIGPGTLVADFCAGLGGTVRYLAYKYGANVAEIEFTPVRVAGAQDLTKRVGLQDMAQIVEGNVMDVPLVDASVDAVVSQESFCHVPDVKKAVMEASRILRTGGRLACTEYGSQSTAFSRRCSTYVGRNGNSAAPLDSRLSSPRRGHWYQGAFGHRLDR